VADEAALRARIRDVPDFPRPGIVFKDITPLLLDPVALVAAVEAMAALIEPPQAVVAIESRGFIFGTALALRFGAPLIPARKSGKLPGSTVRESYSLEYGSDSIELHRDALRAGQRVVVVDDLLATGGTGFATARLVESLGARVETMLFLIELAGLGGRGRLAPRRVETVLTFEVAE
jgi:adenine phosphoribosyltransferase